MIRKHLSLVSSSFMSMGLISAAVLSLPPQIAVSEIAQSAQPSSSQRLDNRVEGLMERQHIPGMAVAIMKNGQVETLKSYGVADIDSQKPIDSETQFPIGSVTKSFTAMAIMLLVEEGKLDLDQPISRYLPNLPAPWQPLTLRQLLSHTSGLSEKGYWRSRKHPQDLLKQVRTKLDFSAGDAWMYSNSGYSLAGLIIEQVSGQTYAEFMRDRIFIPLGMSDSQAQLIDAPSVATGYQWDERREKFEPQAPSAELDLNAYSAGNITSTATDMAKWVQALHQQKLLSSASYQELWTSTPLSNGRSSRYGLGWFISRFNGYPYIEHGGNVVGHSSSVLRVPDAQLDVIVLTNNGNLPGVRLALEIASVYEPALSIGSLRPQFDPNPTFTQRFLSLLQGNQESIPLAPEFQAILKTNRGKYWKSTRKKYRPVEKLTFLHEEVSKGDRTLYYQTSLEGKLAYASIKITAQGQTVGYSVFEPL